MDPKRLPKSMRDDPRAALLADGLSARARPLWEGGEQVAFRTALGPALGAALQSALSAGRIVRGLEGAERTLAAERRGLDRVDRETGVERGGRISRLLVISDDGSAGFDRNVEFLLRRHFPRVLALRLDVDEAALGRLLFGADQVARLALVTHKEAVSAVLLALSADWEGSKPVS